MIGFAQGVGSKLADARRSEVKKAEAVVASEGGQSSSVALVLRTKQEQVNDWYDVRYGKLKSGRARRLSGRSDSNHAGQQAGRSADLGSSRLAGRKALGR